MSNLLYDSFWRRKTSRRMCPLSMQAWDLSCRELSTCERNFVYANLKKKRNFLFRDSLVAKKKFKFEFLIFYIKKILIIINKFILTFMFDHPPNQCIKEAKLGSKIWPNDSYSASHSHTIHVRERKLFYFIIWQNKTRGLGFLSLSFYWGPIYIYKH